MLKYERPNIEIIETMEDIITLSNAGTGVGGAESFSMNNAEATLIGNCVYSHDR